MITAEKREPLSGLLAPNKIAETEQRCGKSTR